MSSTLRRNRLIAVIAAAAMIVVICGYGSHDLGDRPGQTCHCDWTVHFTGVAGSQAQPVPVAKPVLAAWLIPAVAVPARRNARKLRVHLARGPPPPLSIG